MGVERHQIGGFILTLINTLLIVAIIVYLISKSNLFKEHLLNKKVKAISSGWANANGIKIANNKRQQELEKKKNEYLKEYLKEECFHCTHFNPGENSQEYLCNSTGSCPAIDLRPPEIKKILQERI